MVHPQRYGFTCSLCFSQCVNKFLDKQNCAMAFFLSFFFYHRVYKAVLLKAKSTITVKGKKSVVKRG